MDNITRLEEKMKEMGIDRFSYTPGSNPNADPEEVAGEIVRSLEALEAGELEEAVWEDADLETVETFKKIHMSEEFTAESAHEAFTVNNRKKLNGLIRKWTSVKDALPEEDEKVYYYFDILGIFPGKFLGLENMAVEDEPEINVPCFGGSYGFLTGDVTHWMPREDGDEEPDYPPDATHFFWEDDTKILYKEMNGKWVYWSGKRWFRCADSFSAHCLEVIDNNDQML